MSIERLSLAFSHEILRKRAEKSGFLQFMAKSIVSTNVQRERNWQYIFQIERIGIYLLLAVKGKYRRFI